MTPNTDSADFKRPQVDQFVPPEQKDAVDRIVAAGMKMIFSDMGKEQAAQIVQSKDPASKKLATAVVGLMLMLDSQAKGGIPVGAMFPAALDLLGEAAEVLSAAGQKVTQVDYNEAAQMMLVLMAQKMGGSMEQIMQSLQQHVQPQGGA